MIDLICIHCAFTYPDQDIGLNEINSWHQERGFNGCGYNYIIRRDGSLESGRPEGAELAHARGFNRNAVAICLVGGKSIYDSPEANFTAMQLRTLNEAVRFLTKKYPRARVMGHRDLEGVKKDCPCFNVGHYLATGNLIEPTKVEKQQDMKALNNA